MGSDEFLVVGLGASAGGIKALKEFFTHVTPDSGIAYVVILHLSPQHESHLAQVLQVAASIPVTQVTENLLVEPNHVYVIPQNQTLTLQDGRLQLTEMSRTEERRSPVDSFFRTLAVSQEGRAVSVILSGTEANGSSGLKRIKEQGGLCLAQTPGDADYEDMPRNAIATGLVDHILPAAEMPARIISYRESLKRLRLPAEIEDRSTADERALRDIFTQVRTRTGHDFSSYKRGTLLRRIARRIGVHQLPDIQEYAAFLRATPEEIPALQKDLLIGVTSFFRDTEVFDAIEREIIPKLFEGKKEDDQVRVWIPGCATGEEAYSLAMLLQEHTAGMPGAPDVQIFATDIDESAIAFAREGLYTATDAADIAQERIYRFLTKEGHGYRIRKELREMVLFAHHNVLRDPPFAHLDLVSCRNLLIYLNRPAQQRILEVLHFALNPNGYLMLGSSESVEGTKDLFVPVDRDTHTFRSRGVPPRIGLPMPDLLLGGRQAAFNGATTSPTERGANRPSFPDIHHRLVELYAPPSVIVNGDYDILHLSEHAGRYLQFAPGEPSRNLLKVIRPELRLELRTALHQAAHQRTRTESRGLSMRIDDRPVSINLTVNPVTGDGDPAHGFFLVFFVESAAEDAAARSATTVTTDEVVRHLEEELVQVKEHLRSTIEQHETQAEELKASNEELMAINEELRSSTEELETSREELQSLNEELQTVNQELKIKIEEQSEANNDIQNLMNSTELGTIFLDRSLRIKLFTPRARDLFNLIPTDLGRPLSDISTRLVDVEVLSAVEQVRERLERVEQEVDSRDGRSFLMRVLPYRTSEDHIDGVVLTFLDITQRGLAAEQLRMSENRLRLLVESVKDHALFTSDGEGIINIWNAGAARLFGYEEREIVGQSAEILDTPEDRARNILREEMRQALTQGQALGDRWYVRKDGSLFYGSGTTTPLRTANGAALGYAKIARDLTERKQWEDTLTQAHADLEVRVDERTHDLEAANRSLDQEVRDHGEAEGRVRRLLARLITAQEDERRRMGRDLHDHLGQQLTVLRLKLDALAESGTSDRHVTDAISQLHETVSTIDTELDFIVSELRPTALDDLGLPSTLSNFTREWSKNFGIPVQFHGTGLEDERLGFGVETNLYRIAQEALHNVYKHASATHAGVILERRDGELILIIEDNGKGFDLQGTRPAGALGLIGMRERATLVGGKLDIETEPGKGTTIFVRVPFPGPNEAS